MGKLLDLNNGNRKNDDSGSMSLNTWSTVSCMGWSMMSILIGSWNDEVGRSMTINTYYLSDEDWELTSLIVESITLRNGESTSMTVWFSTGSIGGY